MKIFDDINHYHNILLNPYSIVTGIHIAKPNRIMELVISERKLLSFGRLKPTNNYFHFNYPHWIRSQPKLHLIDPDVKDGVDYYTLTYKNRSINLDTVSFSLIMRIR